MKPLIQIVITLLSLIYINMYSQSTTLATIDSAIKNYNQKVTTSEIPVKTRIVKSYYVEEKVNMRFGGYTTTYKVSKLSMVNKYDLGPNNTRVVTPIYVNVYVTPEYFKKLKLDSINAISKPIVIKKTKIVSQDLKINKVAIVPKPPNFKKNEVSIKNSAPVILSKSVVANIPEPIINKEPNYQEALNASAAKKKTVLAKNDLDELQINNPVKNNINTSFTVSKPSGVAFVYYLKTYERIAEKGYRSEEMLKKIGNAFFYDGEYEKAAKWLGELFELKTILEPEYYYRYSKSLSVIHENEKAERMMQLFKEKQR